MHERRITPTKMWQTLQDAGEPHISTEAQSPEEWRANEAERNAYAGYFVAHAFKESMVIRVERPPHGLISTQKYYHKPWETTGNLELPEVTDTESFNLRMYLIDNGLQSTLNYDLLQTLLSARDAPVDTSVNTNYKNLEALTSGWLEKHTMLSFDFDQEHEVEPYHYIRRGIDTAIDSIRRRFDLGRKLYANQFGEVPNLSVSADILSNSYPHLAQFASMSLGSFAEKEQKVHPSAKDYNDNFYLQSLPNGSFRIANTDAQRKHLLQAESGQCPALMSSQLVLEEDSAYKNAIHGLVYWYADLVKSG